MVSPNQPISRRDLLATTSLMAGGLAAGGLLPASARAAEETELAETVRKGRLKQSVCRWCYGKMGLDELALVAKGMGLVAIDLLRPEEFETIKKHGLVCSMISTHSLTDGLCDPKHWKSAIEAIHVGIEAAAKEGWRNVICFSGNARGIDRETGLKNCAQALKEVIPAAEKAKVVLNMELLNSKVDHKDYMCDNSTWGSQLCEAVGSDNFKLLYDIYHMQIMEGDIIRTIRDRHQYFGHYHTAGNPGRNELDNNQELFYPPIAKAIAETGFDGFLAHEFIPKGNPLEGLANAARLCTV